MNTDRIVSLLKIGQLAIDLHAAESAASSAKTAYHAAWRSFECDGTPEFCDPYEGRINRGDKRWFSAVKATEKEYAAFKEARGAVRNIKRRLQTACRKF